MSVTREESKVVDAQIADVADAVRATLARGRASYTYQVTSESDDHLRFQAVIRPNSRMLLSTRLQIELHAEGAQTRIAARTFSQRFIMGDICDYYRDYLRDVFAAITGYLANSSYDPGLAEHRSPMRSIAIPGLSHFGQGIVSILVGAMLIVQCLAFPSSDPRPLLFVFAALVAARLIQSFVRWVNWRGGLRDSR